MQNVIARQKVSAEKQISTEAISPKFRELISEEIEQ